MVIPPIVVANVALPFLVSGSRLTSSVTASSPRTMDMLNQGPVSADDSRLPNRRSSSTERLHFPKEYNGGAQGVCKRDCTNANTHYLCLLITQCLLCHDKVQINPLWLVSSHSGVA